MPSPDEPSAQRRWREFYRSLPTEQQQSIRKSLRFGARTEEELGELACGLIQVVDLLRAGGEQMDLFSSEPVEQGAGGQIIIFPSKRELGRRSAEAEEAHREYVDWQTSSLVKLVEERLGPISPAERDLLSKRYSRLQRRLQAARSDTPGLVEAMVREVVEARRRR